MPPWILRCSPTGAERRIFLSTQRPDKGNELKCRNVESGVEGNACAPLAETYLCASQSRVSPRTPHGLAADACEVSGECWAQPDRMQMLREAMRDWLIVKDAGWCCFISYAALYCTKAAAGGVCPSNLHVHSQIRDERRFLMQKQKSLV